jgi:signal transduction histidine kinase
VSVCRRSAFSKDLRVNLYEHALHGTGLGLPIARVFIEAHDGLVWVESRKGGPGARFCVELPIAPSGSA